MEREIFRKNLKRLREKKGLTQRELSQACNYDPSYVGKIERGAKDPSIESVIRLASTLDVPAVDLFEEQTIPDSPRSSLKNESPENLSLIYQSLFRCLQSNVGLVDTDGSILDANQGLLEINGIEEDEITDHTVETLPMWAGEESAPQWFPSMIERAFEGKSLSRETDIQDSSGTTIRMKCFVYSLEIQKLKQIFAVLEFIPVNPDLNQTKILSETESE